MGEKIEGCVGTYTVACSFRGVSDNFEWAYGSVYGPNDDNDRKRLWDKLARLINWWEMPSCIRGDFNVFRYPGERSGDTRQSLAMMEFSEFIF